MTPHRLAVPLRKILCGTEWISSGRGSSIQGLSHAGHTPDDSSFHFNSSEKWWEFSLLKVTIQLKTLSNVFSLKSGTKYNSKKPQGLVGRLSLDMRGCLTFIFFNFFSFMKVFGCTAGSGNRCWARFIGPNSEVWAKYVGEDIHQSMKSFLSGLCIKWSSTTKYNWLSLLYFVTGGVAPNCIFFFPALCYFFNNQFKQSTRRSIKAWFKCASIAGGWGEACKQMLMLSQVSERASGNASLDFFIFFWGGGGPFWMLCAQHIENLEHKNAIWDKAMTFSPFFPAGMRNFPRFCAARLKRGKLLMATWYVTYSEEAEEITDANTHKDNWPWLHHLV